MSSADMKIWGDANTATTMFNNFMSGQGLGMKVDGLIESTPDEVKGLVAGGMTAFGKAGSAVLKKMGIDVSPEKVVTEIQDELKKQTSESTETE